MSDVFVLPTGTSNLASMMAALGRVASPRLVERPEEIASAARLVVPGVGAFAAAREALVASGAWEPLRARLRAGKPTLLVCLGLQLLAEASDESPGAAGLGVVPGTVTRFSGDVRIPQLGWNSVSPNEDAAWVEAGHAYFANSYFLPEIPAGWSGSRAHHGESFVASIERGDVLACQFHPELSGAWGAALLGRWARGERVAQRTRVGERVAQRTRVGERVAQRAGVGTDLKRGATSRIIPCLDVKDGRIVKGVRFEGLRDAGDPAERAHAYELQGADELVILDVSATPEGRGNAVETVRAVRSHISIPLTVGGGVRRVEDVKRLLDAGADKVAANTAAFDDPQLLEAMANTFGRQCTIVAIDAARAGEGWEVVTRSGKNRTGKDAIAWAKEATDRGAGEILLTSFDRDGTKSGYDLDLLRAVSRVVEVPVIASGGANTASHLAEALAAGADAVLAASIFHEGTFTVATLKDELAARGAKVRR